MLISDLALLQTEECTLVPYCKNTSNFTGYKCTYFQASSLSDSTPLIQQHCFSLTFKAFLTFSIQWYTLLFSSYS